MGSNIMRVVACPDLDGDGYEDVLIASWGSYAEVVSGADGSSIWRTYCGNNVWAIDYTGDVNGDGLPEIIAGSFTNNVYLLNGANGSILWQTNVGAKPFSVRGIGDVNGDGYADVICGTQMLTSGGEVFIISGGSAQVGIAENEPDIPEKIALAVNYPNPFNSSTIIQFNLPNAENYAISIYDIAGRLVDKLSGDGVIGRNTVEWQVGDKGISTGIYFYRIATNSRALTGKMTYLK
jgi:outer membrane protein assembly factor BamB